MSNGNMQRNQVRRASQVVRVAGMAMLTSAWGAAGCAGPTDGDHASETVVATEEGIKNGTPISDPYSGVLAVETWNPPSNGYWTHCTAVLMSPGTALTAKHCVTDSSLAGRTIYARMGSYSGGQRKTVTEYVPHPSLDVAVIRFAPMSMYKWSFNHYTQPPPARDTTTFRRSIYQGSDASLAGFYLSCYGYGPAAVNPPLGYADLPATYHDGSPPPEQVHIWSNGNQSQAAGDSGMPCSIGNDSYLVPVAYIHEGSWWGNGAATWRSWFGY